MLRINTDAAVNLKTRQAGIGFTLVGEGIHEQISLPLEGENWDNHSAEWKAVNVALQYLIDRNQTKESILIHSDSKVVVDSLLNNSAKNEDFRPFFIKIKQKMEYFPMAEIKWIPESKNKGADNLAKQGLEKAKKLYR